MTEEGFGGFGVESSEDYRQAQWLAIKFANSWRYDHTAKQWHGWDGKRWAPDKTGQIRFAVAEMAAKGLSLTMSSDGKKALTRLLSIQHIDRALQALASFSGYGTDGSDWDQDPFLLGCTNGIVDLRTNTLDTHPDPSCLVTKTTGHKFVAIEDPGDFVRRAPIFMQFLHEIMSEDDEMVLFLLQWFGASVFGFSPEQRFLLLKGVGRNGKGALKHSVISATGDYGTQPDANIYMRAKFGAPSSAGARADLMGLKGKRIGFFSEPEGGRFNEEMLKAHTGGDLITARSLYCLTPGHQVLTDDLRWVPVESLAVGDGLWAFSEERQESGHRDRQWTRSVVTKADMGRGDTLRILMASGRELSCTLGHPWLVAGRQGGQKWIEARDLRIGDVLPRYLDTWDEVESADGGWLSGMLDGEGSLSGVAGRNYNAILQVAQREGVVAEKLRRVAASLGIRLTEHANPNGVVNFRVAGGVGAVAAALGKVRPVRLMSKFGGGSSLQCKKDQRDRVVGIVPAGVRDVVQMTTSSGTYFAEGYGSHNSNNVISWEPTHSITFLVNNAPEMEDLGPSMGARVLVADFRERYEDAKEDKRLYDKLKGEADGILAILCWAAKWWYDQWETGEGGMVIPNRVREQSKQFMDRGDPVARFISVACRTGAAERGQAAALYESYSHWHYRADEDGEPLGKHKFAAALERKGFKKVKRESGLFYVGIAPKSAMDMATDEEEDEEEA